MCNRNAEGFFASRQAIPTFAADSGHIASKGIVRLLRTCSNMRQKSGRRLFSWTCILTAAVLRCMFYRPWDQAEPPGRPLRSQHSHLRTLQLAIAVGTYM
ncbi:hypothetical protein EJ03DRAFT_158222 [Teratosphaeria nubilosa]|uniref:Uncharacterized protein n=1 Tax=Teratosphaeria nubilosa TaxID=161662 RepID=A0A6G1L3Y9_9PEZI|nr:hypothetical protein EJ03DRAFT_158222 [Teratosphaeria nubilosa]